MGIKVRILDKYNHTLHTFFLRSLNKANKSSQRKRVSKRKCGLTHFTQILLKASQNTYTLVSAIFYAYTSLKYSAPNLLTTFFKVHILISTLIEVRFHRSICMFSNNYELI